MNERLNYVKRRLIELATIAESRELDDVERAEERLLISEFEAIEKEER